MPDLVLHMPEGQVLDLLSEARMQVYDIQKRAAEGARWEADYGFTDHAIRTARNLELAESRVHMLKAAYLAAPWAVVA